MKATGYVLLMLFILMHACIEPLPYESEETVEALVVDGMITTDPGPYTVRLTMSGPATGVQPDAAVVTGAAVTITDDRGASFQLMESEPGVYQSDASQLRGEVGRSYALRVGLSDGTEYESSWQTILPSGEMDGIYYEFEFNAINQTNPTEPQHALTFYIDSRSDAGNTKGLQRWRSVGIYEIKTFPELREVMRDNIPVPDPLPCSGFVNDDDVLVQVDTCSCCDCWVYEYPGSVAVSSLQYARGNAHKRIAVARVPVDSWRFFRRYYLEAEQLSLSEDVFEFWKRVSSQQKGTGNLFQPNAIKVKGNMRSLSDPSAEVFGVFSATAVSRISIFVNRWELPYPVAPPDTLKSDCRYVVGNSTNVKPTFW